MPVSDTQISKVKAGLWCGPLHLGIVSVMWRGRGSEVEG